MPVGAELVNARLDLGMCVEELSDRTKIAIERLRAIEVMDPQQLPKLAYLKGFLRTYAAEVQLDPDDVIKRYLAELQTIAPGYMAREALPPPVPDRAFVSSDSRWDRDPDLDHIYAMDVMRDAPVAPPHLLLPVGVAAYTGARRRRYLPVLLVGVCALGAGWAAASSLLGAGVNLQQIAWPWAAATAVQTPKEDAPPQSNDQRLARARERAAAAAAELGITPPVAGSPTELRPVPLAEPIDPALDSEGVDVSGTWALTNRGDAPPDDVGGGLNFGFRLRLQQRGDRVTGTGEKWMENGHSIRLDERTQVRVEGTVRGRTAELRLTERGATTTVATFVLHVAGAETVRGRFETTNARGLSIARRMESRD